MRYEEFIMRCGARRGKIVPSKTHLKKATVVARTMMSSRIRELERDAKCDERRRCMLPDVKQWVAAGLRQKSRIRKC